MKSPEHDIQVSVFAVLRLNEARDHRLAWVYAIPNGGHRHAAVAGKLKAEGVKAGISDICLPFPSTNAEWPEPFHGAYIEMKAGKRPLTEEQAAFLVAVKIQGYAGWVARSADEALDFIEVYCGIKLRGRQ